MAQALTSTNADARADTGPPDDHGTDTGLPDPDRALLRGGDRRAFQRLVDRHKQPLFAYLARQTSNRHLAEDLLQEVFMRAYRAGRRGGFDGRCRVRTWLFVLARHCLIDHQRATRSRPQTRQWADGDDGRPHTTTSTTPLDQSIQRELAQRAGNLLHALPDAQREVIAMKVYAGLTFPEIAEVTAAPTSTVKSRMRYGLLKLHELLMADEPGGLQ